MYHPGEVRTPGLELMLILVRLLVLAGVLFLITGIGLLLHLPAGIVGLVAGLVVFFLLVSGSFFEVIEFHCPYCQSKASVIRGFGSYRCSSCNQVSQIN